MSKLYGLVVCGGQSSRMGTDKSLLDYHGQPQRYHVYDMLTPLCERVFISCNEQQAPAIPHNYAVIVDAPEYSNAGPMTAVLSAFRFHSDADFLVVGCDYPYLAQDDLQKLLEVSLQTNNSSAFYNCEKDIYESLIAVYQSISAPLLENNFKASKQSLSRFLEEIEAGKATPGATETAKSIDTWEAYLQAKKQIEQAKASL